MNWYKKIFNMVEIFITNIKSENRSREILQFLESKFPNLHINFDLEDFNKPYPCGHSILRTEGELIDSNLIPEALKLKGIKSEIYRDHICA